jgi:hypothetical protein
MSEETNPGTPSVAEGQQNVQVILDESSLRTGYSNAYRLHQTMEEVIIDLGFNMVNPNSQGTQVQMSFKVTDRIIMSYANAKRLTLSLQQLIKRFEQQFGEIQIGQRRA